MFCFFGLDCSLCVHPIQFIVPLHCIIQPTSRSSSKYSLAVAFYKHPREERSRQIPVKIGAEGPVLQFCPYQET